MNMDKTKLLSQANEEVKTEDKIIEKIHEYTYLGYLSETGKGKSTVFSSSKGLLYAMVK